MRTKNDFSKDKNGRTILASAEDMREWVELGFEAQRKNRTSDMPFPQDVIDRTIEKYKEAYELLTGKPF